jgi:hypothetical protein
MNDTPETNSIIRNAQAADHPPTRLAATLTVKCEKLERERDEAQEKVDQQRKEIVRLNGATNHAGGTPLKIALRERDEANEELHKQLVQFDQLFDEAEKIRIERDEAREKIERQADIGCSFQKTNPAMCGRYKQERDDAREKYATEATEHMLAVNKICAVIDEAVEEIKRLKVILDLIKKDTI